MPLKGKEYTRTPVPPDSESGLAEVELSKMSDITWRIFRIMSEFVEGFQFLSKFNQEVTIFGSSRTKKSDPWYKEGEKLGRLLAEDGYTVITGGGPGVMEAVNKGAHKVDPKRSVGINIELPQGQRSNDYIVSSHAFHYFFTRKVMLAASAQSYVYFPGGFGTMDEFFEMITLIQTGKMTVVPVVLMGKDHWAPLVDWIEKTLLAEDKIDKKDMNIFKVVDTAEEAMEIIKTSTERTIF